MYIIAMYGWIFFTIAVIGLMIILLNITGIFGDSSSAGVSEGIGLIIGSGIWYLIIDSIYGKSNTAEAGKSK